MAAVAELGSLRRLKNTIGPTEGSAFLPRPASPNYRRRVYEWLAGSDAARMMMGRRSSRNAAFRHGKNSAQTMQTGSFAQKADSAFKDPALHSLPESALNTGLDYADAVISVQT